jgi:adenosylcobinamide-phosphate synthase
VKANLNAIVLLFAAIVDRLVGDPWNWLHPVRVMGWTISYLVRLAIARCKPGYQRRWAGVAIAVVLILGSALGSWSLVRVANLIHPLLGAIAQIIILASCFAGRSLRRAANDVLQPLANGDLTLARSQLSLYVGRETKDLDESEILRATLETVAENTPDGVTAPLFYAILGAFLPGAGSVPLALAYKAASTLDSTIGYRHEPYADIGWFSAGLEDRLTWLPCRLTVLTLAILSGQPKRVWLLCRRDAIQDPSPNSGWSECAYAAILGVQLGGMNVYNGVKKYKPLLGDARYPLSPDRVERALLLMRYCFLIWLAIAIAALVIAQFAFLY